MRRRAYFGLVVGITATVAATVTVTVAVTASASSMRDPSALSISRDATQTKQADFLTGVSCTSARSCAAVGWWYHGTLTRSLAIRWNGRAWRSLLLSSGPGNGDSAVSCFAAGACISVGDIAGLWDGTRSVKSAEATSFGSASCATADFCEAFSPPAHPQSVAARWDGHSWRSQTIAEPGPRPDNLTVASVSCVSARFCMAVGDFTRGVKAMPSPAYRDLTLAELWDGTRWRIVPTPDPSTNNQLVSVSCVNAAACTAVGASTARQRTLAERWNGRRWTVQPTPNVNRVGYSALSAVSCGSPTACTAVGNYDGGAFGISEHWNGTRWSLQRLLTPPGSAASMQPVSVSCPAATACYMVGNNAGATLSERWNGLTWTILQTPNPQ